MRPTMTETYMPCGSCITPQTLNRLGQMRSESAYSAAIVTPMPERSWLNRIWQCLLDTQIMRAWRHAQRVAGVGPGTLAADA